MQPDAPNLTAALTALAHAVSLLHQALQPGTANAPGPAVPCPAPSLSLPLSEAVNQYLVAKARTGRSDRYLRQLRSVLAAFARGRARSPLDALEPLEVERWTLAQGWSERTRRGVLLDLRSFFSWCQSRSLCAGNPVERLEVPSGRSSKPPGIHTPDQVRAVLEASRADPDVCRHLALRYFAGLRSAEAFRLREEHLLLDRGYVEVPATMAKTRRRRLVKITPALEAWLALGGQLRGMREARVRDLVKRSGVPWSHNVTRHTWCTYHLAAGGNAGRTALEAGHAEAVLFAHYRALATEEAAAAFWAIRPLATPTPPAPPRPPA